MCEPFIAELSATASYSTSAQSNRQSEKVNYLRFKYEMWTFLHDLALCLNKDSLMPRTFAKIFPLFHSFIILRIIFQLDASAPHSL